MKSDVLEVLTNASHLEFPGRKALTDKHYVLLTLCTVRLDFPVIASNYKIPIR